MVTKYLQSLKKEDLDTPPDGWFIAMGYEREIGTGKWKRIQKTKEYKTLLNDTGKYKQVQRHTRNHNKNRNTI